MSTVFLCAFLVFDTAQQNHSRGTARAAVQQDVRPTVGRMARELQSAGYTPSRSGCASLPANLQDKGITALSSSPVSVTFLADVDGDSCTDQVTYTFVPPTKSNVTNPCDDSDPATVGRITRSVQTWTGTGWNPASPVAINQGQCITALALTYYDISEAVTTTPANVTRVNISTTSVENSRMTAAPTYTLATDVTLRNL
jgi:Tfp pilus assembly protein PilW